MKFTCQNCGQRLESPDEYAGQEVACPSCGSGVTIEESVPGADQFDFQSAVHESFSTSTRDGGLTIASFMAERELEGGVNLGASDLLQADQNRKYSYGEVIARGGMGAILETCDTNIRRKVAMKVLLDPGAASNDDILRFIEEAQVTGQLEHPSVVPVHDLGVDGAGNVFYTMKLVKGMNLHHILTGIAREDEERIAEFPLGRLLTIFQKVCDAIGFAHSRNVIHRDLKPENVMIGEFGEVLVMDWGLAKVLGHSRDEYADAEKIQSVRNQDASGAMVTRDTSLTGEGRKSISG